MNTNFKSVATKNKFFKEFLYLMTLNYDKISLFLQKKYGIPKKPYFSNDKFNSKSHQNLATIGLMIHHYYEKKWIMLCNKTYAKNLPFSYQEPKNLIICNIIEHLLLHIKIWIECKLVLDHYFDKLTEKNIYFLILPGYGGVVNFIVPEILQALIGLKFYKKQVKWKNKQYAIISKYDKENLEKFLVTFFGEELKKIKSHHGIYYPKFNIKFNQYINKILTKHKSSKLFKKHIDFWKMKNAFFKKIIQAKKLQILAKQKNIENVC